MKLQAVRIRNFKAIVDSKTVKLGPLTAFIGNNGSGKSSLIEALETYQSIVRDGLDTAMQRIGELTMETELLWVWVRFL